ncbi:MAG: hypothetical protein IT384_04160 [Deltaproteobacteria bacterium]|nr:hypothetical protein [Deltaproteobacteria bacterium]
MVFPVISFAAAILGVTPTVVTLVDAERLDRDQLETLAALVAAEIGLVREGGVAITPIADRFPVREPAPGVWLRAYLGVVQLRLLLERQEEWAPPSMAQVDVAWPIQPGDSSIRRLVGKVLGQPEGVVGDMTSRRVQGVAQPASGPMEPADITPHSPSAAAAPSMAPWVLLMGSIVLGVTSGFFAGIRASELSAHDQVTVVDLTTVGRVNTYRTIALISGIAGVTMLGSGVLWAIADAPTAAPP